MKQFFLASAFNRVADKLSALIPNPKGLQVAFIPTAAEIYDFHPWLDADRQKLVEMGFEVIDYDLKGKNEEQLYSDLKSMDAVFVAGGNTFYLLYHVQKSGFDTVIHRLLDEGKIYIGSSAGSVLAGPTIEPVKLFDDTNEAPKLSSFEGLGLVDFVILPHFDAEKKDPIYEETIREWGGKVELRALTDEEVIILQ